MNREIIKYINKAICKDCILGEVTAKLKNRADIEEKPPGKTERLHIHFPSEMLESNQGKTFQFVKYYHPLFGVLYCMKHSVRYFHFHEEWLIIDNNTITDDINEEFDELIGRI
jgi:hypothetical protein